MGAEAAGERPLARGLSPHPTRRASWVFVTAVLTTFTLFEAVGFGHFSAFIPLYLPELGVSAADVPRWTALFPGLAFVLGIPLAPFWGVWADKYGRKPIILRSAYIEAGVFGLAAIAPSLAWLVAARMTVGLALGYGGVAFAVLAQIAPRRQVGLAIATVTMGTTIGLAAGPAFGGALAERVGFRALFALDGGLLLLGALVLTFFLEVPPPPAPESRGVWRMLAELGRNLRAHPFALAFYGLYGLSSTGLSLGRAFTPLLIAGLYRGAGLATAVGLVAFAAYLANGLSTPVWGRLGDRRGYAPVLALGLGAAALALAAQAFVDSLPALVVALVLQGIGQSGVGPLVIAAVATRTPEAIRASVLNLAYIPTYFSSLLAAVLGAPLVGLGLRVPYLAGTLCLLGGLAVLGLLQQREKGSSS